MLARVKVRALVAWTVLAAGAGCAASSDPAQPAMLHEGTVHLTSQGNLAVDVAVPAPIKLGKNDLEVSFPSPSSDTTVTLESVTALMPAHGHGSPPPTIERTGDRYSVHDIVLYMSGRWEIRFVLHGDRGDDEAVALVDVP